MPVLRPAHGRRPDRRRRWPRPAWSRPLGQLLSSHPGALAPPGTGRKHLFPDQLGPRPDGLPELRREEAPGAARRARLHPPPPCWCWRRWSRRAGRDDGSWSMPSSGVGARRSLVERQRLRPGQRRQPVRWGAIATPPRSSRIALAAGRRHGDLHFTPGAGDRRPGHLYATLAPSAATRNCAASYDAAYGASRSSTCSSPRPAGRHPRRRHDQPGPGGGRGRPADREGGGGGGHRQPRQGRCRPGRPVRQPRPRPAGDVRPRPRTAGPDGDDQHAWCAGRDAASTGASGDGGGRVRARVRLRLKASGAPNLASWSATRGRWPPVSRRARWWRRRSVVVARLAGRLG